MINIEELLLKVEKPARYMGGEYNTPNMDKPNKARLCMCFPDTYEVGMSNLGISILYHYINEQVDFVAERCFAPWHDMAELLVNNNLPLMSLETKMPLKDFDAIGISVQFEMLYSNILYMLDLAKIPFYAKDRGEEYPIIIGGGPCSINPEPFAPFFDIVVIGEGEDALRDIMQEIATGKEEGCTKQEIIINCKKIAGVYTPLYFVEGEKVVKAVIADYENAYFPTKRLVPNIEIIHDRTVLELYRGCSSGCRFCQAAFFYRPVRERSAKKIMEYARESFKHTGYDEMSLASLSTGDYSGFSELLTELKPFAEENHITLSLPSLRLNSYNKDLSETSRKSSLTFAPEAGTQRLRDVINKNIREEDIISSLTIAFEQGYHSVKLYFMLGLPTETYEDVEGIAILCKQIKDLYWEVNHTNRLRITVSTAIFIPKPFTPFEYVAQLDTDEMKNRVQFLREKLKKVKGINYNWHGSMTSKLEAVFARGDQKLAKVIEIAYLNGAKFDSWSEHMRYDIWRAAFEEANVSMEDYIGERTTTEKLAWDFIDGGVTKEYLISEYNKAIDGTTTKDCRQGCNNCGALSLGKCFV